MIGDDNSGWVARTSRARAPSTAAAINASSATRAWTSDTTAGWFDVWVQVDTGLARTT